MPGFVYEGMSLVRRTCKMMIAEAEAATAAAAAAVTMPAEEQVAQPEK